MQFRRGGIIMYAGILWPKYKHSFYDVKDTNYLVNIKWSKNFEKDYEELADKYFICAYKVCKEIVDSGHNNVKSDMWFLPSVYMFRQSFELGIKALICRTINSNNEIQSIFVKCKHDLYELFKIYKTSEEAYLDKKELKWLDKYLFDLENIDEKSDLFRFPFNDEFLSKYKNRFLDVSKMGNNLVQCYSLIKKCLNKGKNLINRNFNENQTPKFFEFANHGIGNCYLWESNFEDNFHKNVVGYSSVAEFLFFECEDINNEVKVYPIIFLMRNLIELSLKRMFYRTIEHGVDKNKFYTKRKSHLIYKELWKNVRPVLEYYINEKGADTGIINIVEEELKELSKIDKNGDMFRYPTSYSLEYKFNNIKVELKNIFEYMKSIFNYLDCCDSIFRDIEDYEAECRAEIIKNYDYY